MRKLISAVLIVCAVVGCGKRVEPPPEVQQGVEAEKQSVSKPRMKAPAPLQKADFDKPRVAP